MSKFIVLGLITLISSSSFAAQIGPKLLAAYDCTGTENEKMICKMDFADKIEDQQPVITFSAFAKNGLAQIFNQIMGDPSKSGQDLRGCLFGAVVVTTNNTDGRITRIESKDHACYIAE